MVKSRRLEASKGAQQTFARSSPRLPGAEYKLLFSYPVRLHLQTWYLFARCTVCFKFLFLVVVSYINLEECTRSVLGQNLNCLCTLTQSIAPGLVCPLCCAMSLPGMATWTSLCSSLLAGTWVWPSFVSGLRPALRPKSISTVGCRGLGPCWRLLLQPNLDKSPSGI